MLLSENKISVVISPVKIVEIEKCDDVEGCADHAEETNKVHGQQVLDYVENTSGRFYHTVVTECRDTIGEVWNEALQKCWDENI